MDVDDLKAIVADQAGALIGLSRSVRDLAARLEEVERNFDAQLAYLTNRVDAVLAENQLIDLVSMVVALEDKHEHDVRRLWDHVSNMPGGI